MRFFNLFLCIALIFSACSSSTPEKGVLRVNIGTEPNTLDPRMARELNAFTLSRMLFEGLMRPGADGEPELALAKRVDVSKDMLTYTFYLKESVWSNGDALTAHDFVHSMRSSLDPKSVVDNAFQLFIIKNGKAVKEGVLPLESLGLRASDDLTLVMQLEQPMPHLFELLTTPIFYPRNMRVDRENPKWYLEQSTFVCNGPFLISKWEHENEIRFKANPNYWDAQNVHLKSIQMVMVSAETEFGMFKHGDLDWCGSPMSVLPIDAIPSLQAKGVLQKAPMLGTYFIRANTKLFPLSEPTIRRALSMAIQRKEITSHVLLGVQDPAFGLVPPALKLREFKQDDYTLIEAQNAFKEGMQKAHLTLDTFPKLTLMYAAGERNHLIAQAIQEQWKKAFGITIELEANERKTYFSRVSKQDYELASGSWLGDFNDPITFLDVFKYRTTSTNNTHWEDDQYAKLLNASERTLDKEERKELLRASEDLLIRSVPIFPIFHFNMLYLKSDRVSGVRLSPAGVVDFKYATVQDNE